MPRSVVVSVTIDEDLAARLGRLASATHRSEASVVAAAVERYVADEEAFIAAVEEGRAAAREGRFTDQATVVRRIERMLGSDSE